MISKRNDLAISITNKCNLSCPHCLRGGSTEDHLTPSFFDRVLKEAKPFGFSFVSITGGEPFMHPHFKKIIGSVLDNDYQYNFVTNGLFYQEYYDLILGTPYHRNFNSLAISLDGSTKEIHGLMRSQLSWIKATEAIKFYSTKINNPVTVNFLVCKNNLHDVEDTIRLAKKLGANNFWIAGALLSPPHMTPNSLTYNEKEDVINRSLITGKQVGLKINFASCFLDISKIPICPNITNPQPHINPRGELTFCCNIAGRSAVIGSLHKQSFEELWEELIVVSKQMKDYKVEYLRDNLINRDTPSISNCDFCYSKLKEKIAFF